MAKFDVFELSGQRLVVVIQSDYLPMLETQLAIPLFPYHRALQRSPRLNPVVEIGHERYVLMPTLIAALPTKSLTIKVASLKADQDAIADAIDMVLYGF